MEPSSSSLGFGSKVNMDEKGCRRTKLKYRLVRYYLKGRSDICASTYTRLLTCGPVTAE
jgi:hypothetical protein